MYSRDTFAKFAEDCRKIIETSVIRICDSDGVKEPEITPELVYFNGELGLECEPFYFPIEMEDKGSDLQSSDGRLIFDCIKTRYDDVVVACLIAAKRHFGNDIRIHSDGHMGYWQCGIMLAQQALGNVDKEIRQIEEDFENES